MCKRSLFVVSLVVAFSIAGGATARTLPNVTLKDLEFCHDTPFFNADPRACFAYAAPLAVCANRLHQLGPKMIFALLVAVIVSSGAQKEGEPGTLALIERRKCARGEGPYGVVVPPGNHQ